MADNTRKKVQALLQLLEKRFGHVKLPEFLPPPSSADAAAAFAVATKNSELVAGAVLGLHGPPEEGFEAAKRLMTHYVDWNEIRVASPVMLVRVLGRDPRAGARIALLQRFLEVFFLRRRNLNLEYLVAMKPGERRQFLSDLEVFTREELAAFLLSCFGFPVFPAADPVHRVAVRYGLIRQKVTVLQMAKQFETKLEVAEMLDLYSHLYGVSWEVCHIEHPKCPQCVVKNRCSAAKTFLKAARK
jgi:hypothetical protein